MPLPPPLTQENLSYWKERLSKITPTSQRQFGSMEPAAMFRHLRRTIEPMLGDYDPPQAGNFFTRTSLFQTVFLHIPWPKGKVKVPDWVTPPPDGDLEHERRAFFAIAERFVQQVQADPKAKYPNPLMGPIAREYASKLQGKHLNHHAEQFGV